MIVGIREHDKLDIRTVTEAGFDCLEEGNQIISIEELHDNTSKKGAVNFLNRLEIAKEKKYPYVVVETIGDFRISDIEEIIIKYASEIAEANIPIYIENGMSGNDAKGYIANDFSDTRAIYELAKRADDVCGKKLFGICVNTGYVNLLAKSFRIVLEGAGDKLKLIHVNDNDGFKNSHQMPYSFTKGRGDNTTDYYGFVGTLSRMNYDERMIFDTVGLFNRTPISLIPNMLNMLAGIAMYWLHIVNYEGMLDCGRKIILFGSGRMAGNYMNIWGDRFKPSFIVDNDKNKWGTLYQGIEVKSPEAILDVPEDERLVILCNMRYEEIGVQLDKMGVKYTEYDDNYYDFMPQ